MTLHDCSLGPPSSAASAAEASLPVRIAQYMMRNTKQIQKQNSIKLMHGLPESVLLCIIFPAPPVYRYLQ